MDFRVKDSNFGFWSNFELSPNLPISSKFSSNLFKIHQKNKFLLSKFKFCVLGLRISNFEILGLRISNFTKFQIFTKSPNFVQNPKFFLSQIFSGSRWSRSPKFCPKASNSHNIGEKILFQNSDETFEKQPEYFADPDPEEEKN